MTDQAMLTKAQAQRNSPTNQLGTFKSIEYRSTHSTHANLRTRQATRSDIPLIAQIQYEALLPPLNHCFWDNVLEGTNTSSLQFIEVMLKAGASNLGNVIDFFILEDDGRPVAAAAGYTPYSEDYRPLNLSHLDAIAQALDWSTETMTDFRDRYEAMFGYDHQPAFFEPQASWMIDMVAVLPEARGRGFGKALIRALLDEGRSRHHSYAGITIINGNDVAQRTYESVGFKPFQSFYAEYFDSQFPGITKFRMGLN